MRKFRISRAGPDDIKDLKRIEVACGLSPWTIEDYRAEQQRLDSVILKARTLNGTIVGFILGRVPSHGEADIYNIGVDPEIRREGIGGLLLDEFCSICRTRGVSAVWLEVRTTNRAAISFYRARGFVERGVRPGFYSNPTEDAELMCLQLI